MLAVCTKAEAFCASFSRTPPSPPRASARSHAQRSVCGRCGRWPHPMTVLGRNRHFEDATDDLAVFEHVEVVLIPADGRAFRISPVIDELQLARFSDPQRSDFENCPLPTTLSTANPIRTNSANWSAVKPWARMTASVQP